jgi:O-antigen/teichoic acid export membrane protein
MKFSFHLPHNWKKLVVDSVKDFSLWNQLSSMLLRVLYQADVIILGFFVSLSALGDYTIALTIANVFFVVPQLFQKTFSVSFSRLSEKQRLAHGLGLAVKYNALFSIAQLAGYVILQPLIMAFFGPEHPETVSLYAFFIITGVTLFNLARPWVGLTTVKESKKKRLFRLELEE